MKKSSVLFSVCPLFMLLSCDLSTIKEVTDSLDQRKLTDSQIISGLKESLILGSKTAALTLSDTSGLVSGITNEMTGYLANELIRIALPADVENAFQTMSLLSNTSAGGALLAVAGVDFSKYREAIIRGLNRGAENAAGLSADVFKTAISEMTFSSAKEILFGNDSTGATKYLTTTTSGVLYTGFKPIVQSSFSAVEISAFGRQYTVEGVWNDFAENFNKVAGAYGNLVATAASGDLINAAVAKLSLNALNEAGVPPIDLLSTDIVDFTTGEALDGLFYMVGQQELKIRRDPMAALTAAADFVTETARKLIEKVFTSTEDQTV